MTTVLARVWPRPALQAWRERQLLELAVACPPGPGQDRSDWVRSIRQSADQYARAAAEEGSRIHADLAEGRIPPGVQTALLLHDIDLRLGRTEVTMVGDRYGGTIDALGAHWILDWKTTGDSELRVWPDWLVQLAAYDALVGGRSVWATAAGGGDSMRPRASSPGPWCVCGEASGDWPAPRHRALTLSPPRQKGVLSQLSRTTPWTLPGARSTRSPGTRWRAPRPGHQLSS